MKNRFDKDGNDYRGRATRVVAITVSAVAPMDKALEGNITFPF